MALGILKPVLNPLLSPSASNAAPNSAAARRAAEALAAAQQAAASQPGPQQSEGVVFDLSDKALQQVDEAEAARSTASAAQPPAATQTPVTAVQTAAAVGSSGAARSASGASRDVKPAEEKVAPVVSRELAPSDPSEEERARAWAIRGMERGKLLDLVEKLKVTPQADPAEKEVAQHTAAQPFVQAAPDRKGAA
ncbi:hypothetical protein GCM10011402_18960 [Paracoccus acridae]|uniref:Flagellar hook-length control protein FliK n=1 Tax=Paracoccus acridae TaxID=1795310 RepID=A0ABQ1VH46_9RHOB|nr:hypothetical protein [Paracoccus acridae]GGF66859.1 hypothetical protein GCM10011402_18960 [Paracoccus acridae]